MARNKGNNLASRTGVGQLLSDNMKKIIRVMVLDFPGGSDGKASTYNVGDLGSIPG